MKSVSQIINQAGGARKMAEILNLPLPTVYSWGFRQKIPVERVLEIERVFNIPRHEIRPDIYPHPENEDAA